MVRNPISVVNCEDLMNKHIAVVGASAPTEEEARLAEQVGALIGRAGAVLLCGGLGGVMEAAARGAKAANGTTIGILPGTSRADANPYIDYAIATGMGELRNFLLARTADALVALPGKHGTLSEVAMALTLGKKVVSLTSYQIEGVLRASTPAEAVRLVLL
jgi:uncharacterized protein (TIGR00725 family)